MTEKNINDVTEQQFKRAAKGAESITEIGKRLGVPINNGLHRKVRKLASKYETELPVWDNAKSTAKAIARNTLSDKEFFRKGTYRAGSSLRRRLIKLGREYTCYDPGCSLHGKSEWKGEKLCFQVDHVDGDNTNNELSNLRFICPNCHTLTRTYGRRNADAYENCDCGRQKGKGTEGCPHQAGDPLSHPALGDGALCRGCKRRVRTRKAFLCKDCRQEASRLVATGESEGTAHRDRYKTTGRQLRLLFKMFRKKVIQRMAKSLGLVTMQFVGT